MILPNMVDKDDTTGHIMQEKCICLSDTLVYDTLCLSNAIDISYSTT